MKKTHQKEKTTVPELVISKQYTIEELLELGEKSNHLELAEQRECKEKQRISVSN